MSNLIVASSKEEKEKLLNLRIEQIKKKNEELLNKHKLIEEDKRIAELQGRTIKPCKPVKNCGDNQDIRSADRNRSNHFNKDKSKDATQRQKTDTPPMEPAYNFLFDKMRDGPEEKGDRRSQTRRHPRNYGGVNFEDVPKKIQQERSNQNNYRHQGQMDYTLMTTGKERRELDEWRKEREEIDRKRLQRQRKDDGGWKREWDQDKESLFVESDQSSSSKTSPQEKSSFTKTWINRSSSQGHYNRVYHQQRRMKKYPSDHRQSPRSPDLSQHEIENITQSSPNQDVPTKHDSHDQTTLSSTSPQSDYSRDRRHVRNGTWKSWRNKPANNGEMNNGRDNSFNRSPSSSPTKHEVDVDKSAAAAETPQESSVASSPMKSVRFVESKLEEDQILEKKIDEDGKERPPRSPRRDTRGGRNYVGSGRFSGSQMYRSRGYRGFRRDYNMRSPDCPANRHPQKYGNPIKKVYLDETAYRPVEIIKAAEPNSTLSDEESEVKIKLDGELTLKDSNGTGNLEASIKSDEDKKSVDEEGGFDEDEDEQWEDIDEEVCLELDHGVQREEVALDASSESFDQFIINNTLRLDINDAVGAANLCLMDRHDSSMGPEGNYPNVLDWEDDVDSISHLSDADKFHTSDSSEVSQEEKKNGLSTENNMNCGVCDGEDFNVQKLPDDARKMNAAANSLVNEDVTTELISVDTNASSQETISDVTTESLQQSEETRGENSDSDANEIEKKNEIYECLKEVDECKLSSYEDLLKLTNISEITLNNNNNNNNNGNNNNDNNGVEGNCGSKEMS